MTDSSLAERLADQSAPPSQRSFLASHRAAAACKRELDRLAEDVARRLTTSQHVNVDETPVVRLSPDRCIVQLGPVALTVVWLKGARDSVAEGELLVIVWRGAVGARAPNLPERPGAHRAPSATALWERVLVPVAEDEATWSWQPRGAASADAGRCSSSALAAQCTERLYEAYVESRGQR